MSRTTIHEVRHAIQHQAAEQSPQTPLPDDWTETDEMFQNAGKKGERHADPDDPPRRRANKRRGHGTYENDRPPIIGTVGRTSGQVRLRMIHHTDKLTLNQHLQAVTVETSRACTDDWRGYHQAPRQRQWVCHSQGEWARDDDGDGIREVHPNTIEGLWTSVRNFLRPFRGVHKCYLAGYIAICELGINLKHIPPRCVARLVRRSSHAH
jgi:transposase